MAGMSSAMAERYDAISTRTKGAVRFVKIPGKNGVVSLFKNPKKTDWSTAGGPNEAEVQWLKCSDSKGLDPDSKFEDWAAKMRPDDEVVAWIDKSNTAFIPERKPLEELPPQSPGPSAKMPLGSPKMTTPLARPVTQEMTPQHVQKMQVLQIHKLREKLLLTPDGVKERYAFSSLPSAHCSW